ncbi:MAG TPA: TetR/AcrR family transcriptional regulator [Caldilineaceae bacterium]|nr:TetR/AcrR family transcriptional regulator [Caldilineaceae bacterium]
MVAQHTPATVSPQKAEIIAAAQELIAQYGYDGFSIRELATKSNLATATIYHHFHDKEDIFLHVLEFDARAVHSRAMEVVNSDEDILSKLRSLLHSHNRMLYENRMVAMSTIRRIKSMEDRMDWFVQRILPKIAEPLMLVIAQGVAQGIFRPVDTQLAALSLLGLLHQHCMFSLVLGPRDDDSQTRAEASINHIADLFLHGVIRQDSQASPQILGETQKIG